jgi:cation diffusion facilitator family transporter
MVDKTLEIGISRHQTGKVILRIGILSFAVNLALVAAKLCLSSITGSLTLRADGIHSLVDVFASTILILGLVLSNRRSRSFPYGLYKMENLVAAVIAFLLFFAAYEIAKEAISAELNTVSYSGWILVIIAALVLVPLLFGFYERKMGKKYNSPGLSADGRHFASDVLSSSIVFLSVLAQILGFPLDRIGAVFMVLFIVYSAWGLLFSSMRVLLDASIKPEKLEKIKAAIMAEPAVGEVKSLIGRNSGRYIFIDLDITLRITDFARAHEITEKIEQKAREVEPGIDQISIHYEPAVKTHVKYILPLDTRGGLLAQEFGKASYFALVEINKQDETIIKQEIMANPFTTTGKGRGIAVAEFLLRYKPDIVISKESLVRKGPGYAFTNAGVEIRQSTAQTLDELLASISRPL